MVNILSLRADSVEETFIISGYVKDEQTQEPLLGVNIITNQGKTGTSTNTDGYYELQLPAGSYEIVFSFISYHEESRPLQITSNVRLDVLLKQAYITTEEIVIQSSAEDIHLKKTVDNISLDPKEIAQIPFLLGEVDPVKAVQLLPGVQSSGDGNTGFHVRGGGIDQNLILLDDAIIYNAGHLFGFFSVFNGTALDNVELIKGGIPAQYGGRLSSVLNISTKSGDKESWKVQGGVGLIAGNLQIEGPIVKDKSSILLTGRRTYYDHVNQMFLKKTSLNSPLNAYFHDLNLKADYLFSDKDKIELSAYTGKDYFQYNAASSFTNDMSWENQALSLRWKHVFSPRLFSQSSLFYSAYHMDFEANVSSYRFHVSSGVKDIGIKHTLIYTPSETHEISAGLHLIHHRFTPSNIEASTGDTNLDIGNMVQLHNLENSFFLNDEFSLHKKWKLNTGVRLNMFYHIGPFERYLSADGKVVVTDTLYYDKNAVVTRYTHIDPRLSLTYLINRTSSLKLSYDQVHQYTHMAPMSSSSLPTDVWVPSSRQIKPQLGRQYALGYFSNITDNTYEGSVIAYYKDMRNQIEYRDGALISYNKGLNFDDNFFFGNGKSYGAELFIKKNKGYVNGWISYTLSRTLRQFKDLNDGKPFPAKYDRLHDLSVLVNYRRSPKWSFSGVWVFSSGNTMTLPIARYVINGNIINEYSGRNNFRMVPYHRMDLSATYYPREKSKSAWILSIYNVYSRLNPYFLYIDVDGDIKEYYLEVKAKQVSLFPIIPSVTYKFSF